MVEVQMDRPSVQPADVERMANSTLLSYGPDSRQKYSRFWILLALAGIIATAGVANDSTATVIGAMIVAPLMTPILGTAFALVLANRKRMARSLLVVLGGALLVFAMGYGVGMIDSLDTMTQGNSQVSSRVNPRLIDLIAALATGLVGAFALVRADVADTLPGVAIAISLVPPLSVIGLTFQDGLYEEAWGATLLFLTNVSAIIFTATLILLLYRVRDTAKGMGGYVGRLSGLTLAAVVGLVVLIAIPLASHTWSLWDENLTRYRVGPIASDWAEGNDWLVVDLEVAGDLISVRAVGAPPQISAEALRTSLDAAGYDDLDLTVELIVGGASSLPATG